MASARKLLYFKENSENLMNISAKLIKKFDDYYLLDIDLRNIAEADDFTVFLFIAHFFQTEPYRYY